MSMIPNAACLPEIAPEAPRSTAAPEKTEAPERARRFYLTQRRHELLGPVNALAELALFLVEEEQICACERAIGNLTIIRDNARSMAAPDHRSPSPGEAR